MFFGSAYLPYTLSLIGYLMVDTIIAQPCLEKIALAPSPSSFFSRPTFKALHHT